MASHESEPEEEQEDDEAGVDANADEEREEGEDSDRNMCWHVVLGITLYATMSFPKILEKGLKVRHPCW